MKTKEVDISKSRMKMYYFSMRVTVIVGWALLNQSEQSIVGVTYMDDFDFESRYRDVHECDPMYWHPLHLPESCAKMYETLIRSKVGANAPVRVVTKKRNPIYNIPYYNSAYETDSSEEDSREIIDTRSFGYIKPLSPYEKMLNMLRRDVIRNPSAPTITNFPLYGPVAVYNQPISRRSETLIKKMAKVYANAGLPSGSMDGNNQYYGKLDITSSHGDVGTNLEEKNKQKYSRENPVIFDVNKIGDKLVDLEAQRSSLGQHRRRPKVDKKTLPNGDIVTVIQ